MRLTIDIDMDKLAGEPAAELGRILRYWAGAMRQIELTAGAEHELTDTTYAPVGLLRITD